jgi:hypothetical protein
MTGAEKLLELAQNHYNSVATCTARARAEEMRGIIPSISSESWLESLGLAWETLNTAENAAKDRAIEALRDEL